MKFLLPAKSHDTLSLLLKSLHLKMAFFWGGGLGFVEI